MLTDELIDNQRAALVRRRVTANRIGFLADTCATCGGVTVSFGGQVIRRYSLRSATPARDVLISTPVFSTAQSGELRITAKTVRPSVGKWPGR